jgi:hypothetical protein
MFLEGINGMSGLAVNYFYKDGLKVLQSYDVFQQSCEMSQEIIFVRSWTSWIDVICIPIFDIESYGGRLIRRLCPQ